MNKLNTHPLPDLLTSVLETQSAPVVLLDPSGIVVFANDRFHALGLIGTKALIGQPLATHCAAKDRDRITSLIARSKVSKSGQDPVNLTCQIGSPEGGLSMRITQLTNPAGTGLGFLCAASWGATADQDLPGTDRDLETRWKTALDTTDQAVWDIRIGDQKHFVSDAWYRIRGIVPQDRGNIADSWMDFVHPDDLPMLRAAHEKQARGDTDITNYQYRFRYNSDEWIWIQSRGQVLSRTPDGLPERVVGTDRNITELKQNESQRIGATGRLQLALEAAELGIWQYNIETDCVHWDQQMLNLYGVTDGENSRPGSEWGHFLHPEDRENTIGAAQACMETDTDFEMEFRIVRPDGGLRHLRSLARMFHDPTDRTRYLLGVSFDITEDVQNIQALETARAAMEYDSRHDALTGLANRRRLDEYHDELVRGASSGDRPLEFSVLHIDLDGFKDINDTLGHAAGDAVLCHLGKVLQTVVGSSGIIARVGGDEFVILMPGKLTLASLDQAAGDILAAAARPFCFQDQPCRIGLSIGIARHAAADHAEGNAFVAADLALYQAKAAGKNCAQHFEPWMLTQARSQRRLAEEFRRAIAEDELVCFYQPQFDAQSRAVVGLEALVRWQCPGQGLLSPGEFLPAATANGQVAEVDKWVLNKVLEHQAAWLENGLQVPPVSINLSSSRLLDPGLLPSITALNIPPGNIRFELLETTFLDQDEDLLLTNIKALRAAGFEVEIDDFGSGHASILGFIKVAPSRLKVDRGLIAPITTSLAQRKIVRAIIDIAKLCKAEVVAEGVETLAHARVATELGCDILQGFGLARPMPEAEVRAYLSPRSTCPALLQANASMR